MKRAIIKKSAFLSDLVFTFLLVSLFTLCLFRFWRIPLMPALLLSVLCGVLSTAAIGAFLQSKRNAFYLKKSEEKTMEKLLLHLVLLSDEKKAALFSSALATDGEPAKKYGKNRLLTRETCYFLNFRFAPVEADDIAGISRLKTSKKKILLCNQINEQAFKFCRDWNVEVKEGKDVYALLKEKNALPERFLGETEQENKRKKRLKISFAKSNSRRFFVAGALILLTSLITPFPYYYLVFGSLLFLVAALVRIFGYS